MNELSTHIEYLLLNHDCVVVPQFGAFMAMASSASRSDEEGLFFPPLRRVRFNADVTTDDGLLVTSIATAHGFNESSAKRHVQTLVLSLRQQLLADGQIDFGSIGIFTQDEDGHLEFSACQAGAVSPELYGLDAFVIPKVTTINKGTRARKSRLPLLRQDSDSHITIHISRRALRQALTTAAAVMLCVMLSVPLRNSTNDSQLAALTTPSMTISHAEEQPVAVIAPVEATEQHVAVQAEAEQPKAEQPKKEQPKPEQPKAEQPKASADKNPTAEPVQPSETSAPTAFAVVLASATSDANARSFVKELQDIGYTNARIYDNGRLKRVILDGYATEAEALNAKHELQWNYEGFDDAWLLRP